MAGGYRSAISRIVRGRSSLCGTAGPPTSSPVLAPQQSPLFEMVSALAPSVASGNTAVVVTSKAHRWLAEHADGDGTDLNGLPAGPG